MVSLDFTILRLPNGVWIKERPDGRRGPCVADEAVLWQALQEVQKEVSRLDAAPDIDIGDLVKENERLHKDHAQLVRENEQLNRTVERLSRMWDEKNAEHASAMPLIDSMRAEIAELVRENERLVRENEELNHESERLLQEMDRMCSQGNQDVARLHTRVAALEQENAELRANQRRKPGRPRKDAAGAEAGAATEHDPLDEDL